MKWIQPELKALQSGHGMRDGRTDGQTDGRTDTVKPIDPNNFVVWGIIMAKFAVQICFTHPDVC